MFRYASDSVGKCIFYLLKALNLCERKSVVKRVTIVKTRKWARAVAIVAAVIK